MSETNFKPGGPDVLVLTACATCSRNDRWTKLTDRHFASGGLCPGPVIQVRYIRESE